MKLIHPRHWLYNAFSVSGSGICCLINLCFDIVEHFEKFVASYVLLLCFSCWFDYLYLGIINDQEVKVNVSGISFGGTGSSWLLNVCLF